MSYGVHSVTIPNYDFQSQYVGNDFAYKLCFNSDNFYITVQTPNGTNPTLIESTKTKNNPDRFYLPNRWTCEGFRDPWIIKSWNSYRNDDVTVGTGYLFRALTNQDYCNEGAGPGMSGPGMFVRVITASQINRLNDPDYRTGFGSISEFILDYSRAYSRSTRDLLPYLKFDEVIFYVEPKSSPFTSSTISISPSRSGNLTNLDIIKNILSIAVQKYSIPIPIPLSEFAFFSTSSDDNVAKVNPIRGPFGSTLPGGKTITFIQSGTFVLTLNQQFYQDIQRNVIYLKQTFEITVHLTINDN